MIEIQPFTQIDFPLFKSWIHSEEELVQFAGPLFSFPLTDEQLIAYLQMHDKHPFKVVLSATQETIGHCEINRENGLNRLCRILIGNPQLRGQKIGEQIVRLLIEKVFEDPKVKEVDLNVYDWNKSAIACYEKVGFVMNPVPSKDMQVNGEVWKNVNMVFKKLERLSE